MVFNNTWIAGSSSTIRILLDCICGSYDTKVTEGLLAELTAYRIVQEALTNTLRHATARHATVIIAYDQPQLRLRIADDGTTKAPDAHRGHGIEGMRERAALHGGTLRAGPDPDAPVGWLVEATLEKPG